MLYEAIMSDIKDAMKSKNITKKDVLKQVQTKAQSDAKENKSDITDEVVIKAINKELKQLNQTKEAISSKLTLYCRANGKYLSGLYNRRLDEQRLFKTPVVSGNIGKVIAPSGLNIRETPSTNSTIIKAIPFGNKLEIVERLESGWLHINYGDVNGYVYGKWVV